MIFFRASTSKRLVAFLQIALICLCLGVEDLLAPDACAEEPEPAEDKEDLAAPLIAAGVHAPLAKWLAAWADARWGKKAARRTLLRELLEVLRASANAGGGSC